MLKFEVKFFFDDDDDYDDNGYDEQENDDDDDDDDANTLHSSGMGVHCASQTKPQDRSQKLPFRSKMHRLCFFNSAQGKGRTN